MQQHFWGPRRREAGCPNVLGSLLGAATLGILANGLTILNVPSFLQDMLTGAIVVAAIVSQNGETRIRVNNMKYIASFDIGSSAIKAVLVDSQCRSHHQCSRDYAPSADAPGEQHPQLWWDAFCELLLQWRSQGVDLQGLAALTFSGQMQDMIALDAKGEAVRPAVLYMDARAGEQAAHIVAQLGQANIDKITRNPFNAGSVLPKILHLKDHEPAHLVQTKQVLLGAKDFIIFRLTGASVCDPTTAATTGMYVRLTMVIGQMRGWPICSWTAFACLRCMQPVGWWDKCMAQQHKPPVCLRVWTLCVGWATLQPPRWVLV
jgi:hypothetical protein